MNNQTASWLLFVLNPFMGLIFSLRDYLKPYSKNLFWMFCVFYGLTFTVSKEFVNGDIVRYIDELKYFYNLNGFSLNDLFLFYLSSGEIDFVNLIITYLISRFTENGTVLTTVYGFVFGYFFSRNIWYILNLYSSKFTILEKLLILSLLLVVPIWNINGIRMYLAFHVFMYGLLPFLIENKKGKLFFLFFSIFIHFSFTIPISVFLVHLLVGNRLKIYFIIFVVSIFISELEISTLNNFIDNYIPNILTERTSNYRNELVVESYRDNIENNSSNWYLNWFEKLLRWGLEIFLIYFFLFPKKQFAKNRLWKNFFSASLLFFTVANILSSFPSGTRFYIFPLFLVLFMILYYSKYNKTDFRFNFLLSLLFPVLVLFIVVSIRISFYSASVTTVFGNLLLSFLSIGNNLPLNDLIK